MVERFRSFRNGQWKYNELRIEHILEQTRCTFDVRKLQSCIHVDVSIIIIICVCEIEWKLTVCVLNFNKRSVLENVSHGQLPYIP